MNRLPDLSSLIIRGIQKYEDDDADRDASDVFGRGSDVVGDATRSCPGRGTGAVAVGTVYAERKPIAKTADFVGRIEAINRVEIRARAKGLPGGGLCSRKVISSKKASRFTASKKGVFEAEVEQAAGALERAKASLTLAGLQRTRAEDLLAKASGTVVARDQAVAEEGQAKGAVMADEANLRTAKINLGYTDITAPIAGKIGRTSLTKGNVVGPESGPLTTIVSQNPMYVTFPVSQREFLQAQNGGEERDRKSINVRRSDGSVYDQLGVINFIDVTVDRTTDTVIARATIPNPNGVLIDGQLVRVLLESGEPKEAVVIPQSALIADQQGVATGERRNDLSGSGLRDRYHALGLAVQPQGRRRKQAISSLPGDGGHRAVIRSLLALTHALASRANFACRLCRAPFGRRCWHRKRSRLDWAMPKTQPQTKVTPMSPGNPPGQSMISNLILYPRGRR